uniref:Reverse transcriptase zinc-binding domain-containing protein n=1 Tax=Picea glauca TaxID=3330 RepID=A0A101LYV1_PICGL|nr:hypothetical protein ABT39_MTgene5900 [Picea glauca]QHR92075.1 hypothetical protein Q903MT_gene6111 [Picea sitchensis]
MSSRQPQDHPDLPSPPVHWIRLFHGGGQFSVKQGYLSNLISQDLPPQAAQWKRLWSGDCLPKVRLFCWVLVHGRILTAENMKQRGIQEPSRYSVWLRKKQRNIFS